MHTHCCHSGRNQKHWLLKGPKWYFLVSLKPSSDYSHIRYFSISEMKDNKKISLKQLSRVWLQKCRRIALFLPLLRLWSAEISVRTWTGSKKCLRVLLLPPLQEGLSYFDVASHQVLFAFQQHWKHSEVKNTLWDRYKGIREIKLCKVHCACRRKPSLEDQCFPVTGNIKERSSSKAVGIQHLWLQETGSKEQFWHLKAKQHPSLQDASTSALPSTLTH